MAAGDFAQRLYDFDLLLYVEDDVDVLGAKLFHMCITVVLLFKHVGFLFATQGLV